MTVSIEKTQSKLVDVGTDMLVLGGSFSEEDVETTVCSKVYDLVRDASILLEGLTKS